MKHAEEVEEQKKHDQLIEAWKKANGFYEKQESHEQSGTWSDTVKTILTKPYLYIFLTLALISPYGVQIVEKLIQFYGK